MTDEAINVCECCRKPKKVLMTMAGPPDNPTATWQICVRCWVVGMADKKPAPPADEPTAPEPPRSGKKRQRAS